MSSSVILDCLQSAPMQVVGEFVWGSNATFLVELECGGERVEAVYKPVRGERPLWDFPPESLAGREVAAHLLSEALGWGLVPPTVWRADGPAGAGSLQWRVPHDPEQHYFTFSSEARQGLRPTALFDLLANNADRKGGHILIDANDAGKFWLIDQGLCFHAEPKLRTVVWDFSGEAIPDKLLTDLERLQAEIDVLREALKTYLNAQELDALQVRLGGLLQGRVYPAPPEDVRAVPYPLV